MSDQLITNLQHAKRWSLGCPVRHGWASLAAVLAIGSVAADNLPGDLSETEYLTDIPRVYSASRLPQLTQDAAGATTIIDREMIRASGARELTDLFRLVPGFQVGTSSGGRPVVSYHGLSGQISQRMQVYVDGRSLYAPYLFGGIDWSSLSVPLDEIEHIEIQRGSNSVTYGANAFLGVIHIITRSAAQSVGWYAQTTQGSEGIADRYLRWGASAPNAQWRVAAGTKSDDGLINRTDAYSTDYIDLRAEIQTSPSSELSLTAGLTKSRFGIGYEALASDPTRTESAQSSFFHGRYKHTVDTGHEWSVYYSRTQDAGDDRFDIPLLNADTIPITNERQATRTTFGYQHFKTLTPDLRASWGLEFSSDNLVARQLFNTAQAQTSESLRAYLNQEWKPTRQLTLNLGGLIEKNGLGANEFAPRASLSWKPTTENTFKLGYSAAFRNPSLFEQRANWRTDYQGQTLNIRYLSRGGLVPEQVSAWDLIYIGQSRTLGLALDARLFQEKITQLITGELYLLPSNQANTSNAVAYDLRNNAQATNTGIEYQLSWRPSPGSLIVWNQFMMRPESAQNFVQASIPEYGKSLLVSHAWPSGLTTGLSYSETAPVRWLGESNVAGQQSLVSLRLAQNLRLQDINMVMAAVWRQPMGDFDEFRQLQRTPKQLWISISFEY